MPSIGLIVTIILKQLKKNCEIQGVTLGLPPGFKVDSFSVITCCLPNRIHISDHNLRGRFYQGKEIPKQQKRRHWSYPPVVPMGRACLCWYPPPPLHTLPLRHNALSFYQAAKGANLLVRYTNCLDTRQSVFGCQLSVEVVSECQLPNT